MYIRIKELREDNDLTQQQVADYLQIDQSNYSKIEKGKQYLKDEILVKLANFYCTSIDYLLRSNKSEITLSSCTYEHKKIRTSHEILILCNVKIQFLPKFYKL